MPDIAPAPSAWPVLAESDASRRVMLLAELQAALAALGIQSVLIRNRRLVLRSAGNSLERSGPTDPQLHVFAPDGTETATTDGTRYELTTGPPCPPPTRRQPPPASPAACTLSPRSSHDDHHPRPGRPRDHR